MIMVKKKIWKFNMGHTPADGEKICIKIPVAGHDYGVFVSIIAFFKAVGKAL